MKKAKEEFKQKMILAFSDKSNSALPITMLESCKIANLYREERIYTCSEFGLVMKVSPIPGVYRQFNVHFIDKGDFKGSIPKDAIELTNPTWHLKQDFVMESLSLHEHLIGFRLEYASIKENNYDYSMEYHDDGDITPDVAFDARTGEFESYGMTVDAFINECKSYFAEEPGIKYSGYKPNKETADEVLKLDWNPNFSKEVSELIAGLFEKGGPSLDMPIFARAAVTLRTLSPELMKIYEETKGTL